MAGGDSKYGRAASVLLSIFMVLTVLVSSGMLLGGISVLEGTTTADVSASDNSLSNEGTVLFSDDFNDGTLNKWTLSGWNPSGLMEVTSSISHSPDYSAHAQSDPDTNTGPYIAAGFNDTNDVLVEAWIYLPQKTQAYDIFKLLQIRTIEGGFSDISDMAAYSYYLSFELDDDNYGLDLVEGVRVDGVLTHNEHMNVLDLEPETWYKLGIRVDDGRYSMLLNDSVIYESQRYDNRSVNLVLFGDIGGSSGGWGDAYLDDVKVSEISTPRNVDLSISDSDVSLSEGNPMVGDEVTIEATVHNEPVQHSGWIKQGVVMDYTGFDPGVQYPFVLKDAGFYKMWYTGLNLPSGEIYYATSTDGKNWIDQGTAVSVPSGLIYAVAPSVLKESDGTYKMWFSCQDSSWNVRTYLATSADGINWNNQGVAVDIGPSGSPDAKYVAQAKVFVDSGLYKMYYKAYDDNNIPSIMYATSSDGYSWTKQGVVMPLPAGFTNMEAPFVLKNENGTYTMWYSAVKDGVSKIYVAYSTDGVNWEQGGLNLDIGVAEELDDEWVGLPYVLKAPVSGEDWLYYTGSDGSHRRIFIATMGTQSPSDATCSVFFYLDNVSEQNLIYREDNVFVPANGETTVTALWTAVGGDHDIKVVLSDIIPSDLNLSNNRASAQLSVGSPECVDLSISDSDILLSEERPADGSNLTVSATVHGDYDVQESTANSEPLFRDDFNDGSLSKWSLSSWNPSGLMEVTSSVSHSPDYSAHAQSDPDTNTGPYIATGFNDTKDVLVEGWIYLPVKSQQYDKFNLLQVRHVDGGFTGSAEMSSNTIYYMGFQLSDDNYDVDLYEGVKVDGVWTRSTHLNVLSLEPERWYKLGIRIDDTGFSMLVDDQAVYRGERLSGDIINTVVFGDTYGSSGGWGDAYLDDVTVTAYTEGSGVVHRAANATCSVSFYLDNVSEQNLIYREDNVFVPANGETTVTAPWTAVEGEHNIIVRVTDVNPSDSDMSNNMAMRDVSVSPSNSPPVADAGPDQTVYVGDTVYFDGSGSYDEDGGIASYEWQFGDNSSGAGVNVTHVYAAEGTYTVTLTVTDDAGLRAVDTATVFIQAPATSANMTISKEKIDGPDIVETHTKSNWSLLITVKNDGGSDAFAVTVHDVLPAELSLEDYTISQGRVIASQEGKGKMGSTAITWVVGTLNPGEIATFTMRITTVTNPGCHQEFTSPGNYSLNDGAWLTAVDSLTMLQIAAGPTPAIIVTAVHSVGDGNHSCSNSNADEKSPSSSASEQNSDTTMTGSGDIGTAGVAISINSLSTLLVIVIALVLLNLGLLAVLWLRRGGRGGNIRL